MPKNLAGQGYARSSRAGRLRAAGTRFGCMGRFPIARGGRVGIALGLIGATVGLSTPAPGLANPPPGTAAGALATEDWIDALEDLLCLLYRIYGGDCADFDNLGLDGIHVVLASAVLSPGTGTPPDPTQVAITLDIDEIVLLHGAEIDAGWGTGLAQDYLDLMEITRLTGP